MHFAYRVERSHINYIVPELCDAIIRHYQDQVILCSIRSNDWKEIEQGFRQHWNVNHAIVLLDGKHVPFRCPRGDGRILQLQGLPPNQPFGHG